MPTTPEIWPSRWCDRRLALQWCWSPKATHFSVEFPPLYEREPEVFDTLVEAQATYPDAVLKSLRLPHDPLVRVVFRLRDTIETAPGFRDFDDEPAAQAFLQRTAPHCEMIREIR